MNDRRALAEGLCLRKFFSNAVSTRPPSSARTWLSAALVVLCLGLAGYLAFSSVTAIWQYGFGEIFADQYRQYQNLHQSPLLEALFSPDNGHRQALSNVVRLIDIEIFGGAQRAGIIAGVLAMLAAWALLLRLLWSGSARAGLPITAAATLLITLALFWLGSGRMQFHGNETFQVYFTIACAALAITCVEAARNEARARYLCWAYALGLAATLSFATGVAVYGMVIAYGVIRRIAWRPLLLFAVASMLTVYGYLYVLPGGDGVRNTLSLAPVALLETIVTWLSSAWLTAWLMLGTEGFMGAAPESVIHGGTMAQALVTSSAGVRAILGSPTPLELGLIIGAVGILILFVLCVRAWNRASAVGGIEAAGIGLALFSTVVATLVALGRLTYFEQYPAQVLADRYVIWTCVFWCGLALASIARLRSVPAQLTAAVAALLLGIALLPTQQLAIGWAAASVQHIEQRTAQAQSRVFLPGFEVYADLPDRAALERAISYFSTHQFAIFRHPRSRQLGDVIPASTQRTLLAPEAMENIKSTRVQSVEDAWHLRGRLPAPADRSRVDGIWISDVNDTVIGLGEFAFADDLPLLQRVDQRGNGFEAYLRLSLTSCETVTIWAVDDDASEALRIGQTELCP